MQRCVWLMAVGVGAALLATLARPGRSEQKPGLQPTIGAGKQVAVQTDIAGSVFRDVNLAGAEFENVNLGQARLHDINLSGVSISAANLGGAHFKHLGPPPGPNGEQPRQKAVTFEDAQLCDSTFRKVDLSNVKITECNTKGMTIDGVLVSDMIAAYKRAKR